MGGAKSEHKIRVYATSLAHLDIDMSRSIYVTAVFFICYFLIADVNLCGNIGSIKYVLLSGYIGLEQLSMWRGARTI